MLDLLQAADPNSDSLVALSSIRLAPLQALVVEDDLGLRAPIQAVLHIIEPRMRIDWRTSVDHVLADLHQNWRSLRAYDLIITDVFVPGSMDGLEMWKACRFNCPNVRFIVISGMDRKQFNELTCGQGLPFLAKPFNPVECIRLVKKVLGR